MNNQKLIAAALLFATWGGFALAGLTPVSGFINAVYAALVALGVFHISTPSAPPAQTNSQPEKELPN